MPEDKNVGSPNHRKEGVERTLLAKLSGGSVSLTIEVAGCADQTKEDGQLLTTE